MKVVVNRCYGGFGLSAAAVLRYAELKGLGPVTVQKDKYGMPRYWIGDDATVAANRVKEAHVTARWHEIPIEDRKEWNATSDQRNVYPAHIERTDPALIQTVEELGEAAYGTHAQLEVVEIPDGIKWSIDDYDGIETIEEEHRSW